MLIDIFGQKAKHSIFGDFKSLTVEPNPAFYIHLLEKAK